MSYQTLTLEICDGLATLTLDRPERANSIDVVTAADLRRESAAISTIIKTGDAVEGITGFLEKRAPTFKGH